MSAHPIARRVTICVVDVSETCFSQYQRFNFRTANLPRYILGNLGQRVLGVISAEYLAQGWDFDAFDVGAFIDVAGCYMIYDS